MSTKWREMQRKELNDFKACAASDQPRAREMLAKNPALLDDVRTGLKETALHYLAVENHLAAVEFLLKMGAAVDPRNFVGATPLLESASLGYIEMVRRLLANGADVNASDDERQSVLHHAARHANLDVIRVLVAAGADVNALDSLNRTPLHEMLVLHESSPAIDFMRASGAEDLS